VLLLPERVVSAAVAGRYLAVATVAALRIYSLDNLLEIACVDDLPVAARTVRHLSSPIPVSRG
jgi:hypothetical protein